MNKKRLSIDKGVEDCSQMITAKPFGNLLTICSHLVTTKKSNTQEMQFCSTWMLLVLPYPRVFVCVCV